MIKNKESNIFKELVEEVSSFKALIETPFTRKKNAVCWSRKLTGDFSEIVNKVEQSNNLKELCLEELNGLKLSQQGQLARTIILNDHKKLSSYGASPVLNIIKNYDKDDSFFPTDVYSFHVDQSPIPIDTFLCTYFGEASEILPNNQAKQKVIIPKIRKELLKLFGGKDNKEFESFLNEYFFDLHYEASNQAEIINLGNGHLWKIATDHPKSKVSPCIHRAPKEKSGESRLMLIC